MKKILVVEDVELNMDLLVQLLEDEYEVLTAMDGAVGIEVAKRECPDLHKNQFTPVSKCYHPSRDSGFITSFSALISSVRWVLYFDEKPSFLFIQVSPRIQY